jgi:hypothetical protein
MPDPNAIVSAVIRFDPPLDRPPAELLRGPRGLSVELEGGRRVRLDPENPRSAGLAEVLDELSKRRHPAYLEVDPATSTIIRLFIPLVSRVLGMRPIDTGVLGVELERSHARHVLRSSSPDFAELEGRLREAIRSRSPVILSENDRHEVLDVRSYTPGPEGPPFPFPRPEIPREPPWPLNWLRDLLKWILWPILSWWRGCISEAKAQQVFDAMNATNCNPLTVPVPCIPFLYPDNGCWARAHEMCRLMLNMGLKPKKVWIHGSLYVATKNSPVCEIWWGWHVAPTLCVRGPKLFQHQRKVIDPSLFATPVSKADWKAKQGDPNATLTDTDASYYWFNGSTDPSYVETLLDLAQHRTLLKNRSLQHGPPPYAHCP